MNKAEAERTLRLLSRAWGRRQSGYCFFPWIDREAQRRTGSRKAGYHEGPDPENPAFRWPQDRDKIIQHMLKHQKHDLYWCPSLFEYPVRRTDVAMDEHALWADLDESDPRDIDEKYRPTIAWETSPGRFQALWIAGAGDFQGASWPGNENQRMTYMLNADASGWDTTQLLRIPGWTNHKPDRPAGFTGRLLWTDGPTYQPGDFSDLPEVRGAVITDITDAIEAEIDGVDRHKVIARVQLRLNHTAREMLKAREASGDRSSQLWYLTRCLADVGCSVSEIVAIVRETVWNKFRDRADETRVLISEASKAIAQRSDETLEKIDEEDAPRLAPQRLGTILRNIKRPSYIIDRVITEGSCGFIAGEPKSFKSWFGLDMALSIATGAPFLGEFRVERPGPVLYIQEEDPPPIIKSRAAKIWQSKATDKIVLTPSSEIPELEWLPPEADREFDPDINAMVQGGVVISDPAWLVYLDEILAEGMDSTPYVSILIDTLMMTAGDVEENRSQEMTTKIFKPLKTLSRKHNVAVSVVHHMGKADKARGGQRMLGSVANHAWSEDSIYLGIAGGGDLRMEVESKSGMGGIYRVGGLRNLGWTPDIRPWRPDEEESPRKPRANGTPQERGPKKKQGESLSAVLKAMDEAGKPMTTADLQAMTGISRPQVWRQLRKAQDDGKVTANRIDNTDHWSLV